MIVDAWAQHPTKALEVLDTLGLDEQARALFLSGNAMRVFALGA